MSHLVNVADGLFMNAWDNFVGHIDEVHGCPWPDRFWLLVEELHDIQNIKNSPYVRFPSEEDSVVFLLRWS